MHKPYALLLLLLLLAACSKDETEQTTDDTVRIPIHLTLPASDAWETRLPGDPGYRQEVFRFPRYIYAYLVTKDASGTEHVHEPLLPANAGTPNLAPEQWVRELWQSASPQTKGDSIYRYNGQLTLALDKGIDRKEGRIYILVSPVYLEPPSTPTTETGVQTLQFDFPAETTATNHYNYLKDIYSTPYNYNIGGKYYATVQNIEDAVPQVDVLLYHVAAKVDVMWNVAAEKQSAMHVTKINFTQQKHNACYVFQPNANKEAGTDTYPVTYQPGVSEQWYGRYTYYAIPYAAADSYTIPVSITTSSSTKPITRTISTAWDAKWAFTPWIRADINL